MVYGVRIDYLSPTLYFLDLLIILYLFIRKFENLKIFDLRLFCPLLLTNILYSQNPLATLSWSLHLILYLYFVVSLGSDTKKIIASTIAVSLLFQTILASAQVYLGHSAGGLIYYLGERMVSVGSPGIALGSFMGQVVLRAYGTFSHPNILAGYAAISLLIILIINKKKFENLRIYDLRLFCPLLLTTTLVFLTHSRAAALSLFGIIIPLYIIKKLKYRILYFVIILSTIYYAPAMVVPTRSDLSSSGRLTLQSLSLSAIRTFPVFGTGAQSSISTYPRIDSSVRLLQPDHNTFTLFLSWFGIFGLLGAIFVLRPMTYNLLPLLPILPLLLFDHYLLTSPQGLFISLLYLGSALNYSHVQKNR